MEKSKIKEKREVLATSDLKFDSEYLGLTYYRNENLILSEYTFDPETVEVCNPKPNVYLLRARRFNRLDEAPRQFEVILKPTATELDPETGLSHREVLSYIKQSLYPRTIDQFLESCFNRDNKE